MSCFLRVFNINRVYIYSYTYFFSLASRFFGRPSMRRKVHMCMCGRLCVCFCGTTNNVPGEKKLFE